MEAISSLRKLIAENKLHEAQVLAEQQLATSETAHRGELIVTYLEVLELLDKKLPSELLLEAAEVDEKWLTRLSARDRLRLKNPVLLLQIKVAEKKGRLDDLHDLISRYLLNLFEDKLPVRSDYVTALIASYFRNDFQLKLQELSLVLLLGDLAAGEALVKELIFSCVERSSPRGVKEKLDKIGGVLRLVPDRRFLVLYEANCDLAAHGLQTKQDYKRLLELVIFFEDFRPRILILDLLVRFGLADLAAGYASELKAAPGYDFVYLDKYFPSLKAFFVSPAKAQAAAEKSEGPAIDLRLEKRTVPEEDEFDGPAVEPQDEEDQDQLITSMKFQEFTVTDLLELAVSFLQSLYPKAAHYAANRALASTQEPETILKASYLKATALFVLGDYRAVLDTALAAAEFSRSKADILAFLYLQADAQLRLQNRSGARALLQRISAIDSDYRLTRARLQRLDETK